MYSIRLIGTRHQALGKCNLPALYTFIEQINPGIIFEEIPPSFFDRYYISKSSSNLETNTINLYLQTHDIKQVAVDSDDVPSDDFFRDYRYMLKRVEGQASQNGFNYRNFVDKNRVEIATHGFAYLNSPRSEWINDEIQDAIDKSLQEIDDASLSRSNELWKEVNNSRENEMLDNIYKYSQENKYSRAIFTVGFAHRKSIKKKIAEREKNNEFKLNWKFSDD